MQQNTLIKVSGELVRLPDGELSLEQMYAAIGCDMVERVQVGEGSELWCDEEGLLKARPQLNYKATMLYRSAYPDVPAQELGIVGNAILSTSAARMAEIVKQYEVGRVQG